MHPLMSEQHNDTIDIIKKQLKYKLKYGIL